MSGYQIHLDKICSSIKTSLESRRDFSFVYGITKKGFIKRLNNFLKNNQYENDLNYFKKGLELGIREGVKTMSSLEQSRGIINVDETNLSKEDIKFKQDLYLMLKRRGYLISCGVDGKIEIVREI